MDNLPAIPDTQIDSLIAQALDKQVPVESLERLLTMRDKLRKEYAQEQFDKDMASFQAECPIIHKARKVPNNQGGGYSFAPIESIVSQVKEVLHKYNFSYAIQTETTENYVASTCIVKHVNGHSESSRFQTPLFLKTAMMNQAQQVAATLTFCKRYAFCNAFGILTGDEDTDARTKGATIEQLRIIREQLEYLEWKEVDLLRNRKIPDLQELSYTQAEELIQKFNTAVDEKIKDKIK